MGTYCYEYPRPGLGADILLFSKEENTTYLLLIERGKNPYAGYWAFPGGFVEEGESCETAALRELKEETNVDIHTKIYQIGAFSTPGRDPRGWIVSVAYYTFVNRHDLKPSAGDDAREFRWFPIHDIPKLAFDHREILDKALDLLGLLPN